MENRRLLMAALLSALVLIAWNYMMMSLQPPEEVPTPEALEAPSEIVEDASRPEGALATESPALEEEGEITAPPIDFAADEVVASGESLSVIETDEIRAEFTNLGAQLVSFKLKRHLTSAGEPLELVRPRGRDPYPFALVAGGREETLRLHRLNKALFEGREETAEDGSPVLRFQYRGDRGAAEKVFRWTPQRLLAVEVTIAGERDWGLILGPGVRVFEEHEDPEDRFLQRQASYRRAAESETIRPEKLEGDLVVGGRGLQWTGLEDSFFLNAAIPRSGLSEVVLQPVLQRGEVLPDAPRFQAFSPAVEQEGTIREILMLLKADGPRMELLTFFGAKQYRRLAALPYGLEETVRWGSFIGFLARPLYMALEWIHERIVANYGWAIVLVTCLIRVLFFPLTYKSQDSMAKMQELNPKVQAIRNKYRTKLKDRQGRPNVEAQRQLNDEIMAVYRSAGVNPVSGCFPILLQMPVFFAFFRLLSTAVELRNAPWLLWIRDLSSQDPYYVLPLLMGATSIGMQQMMPQSPEPMQRRMMQIMPIMFTFFALYFPSGLVLYWLTNNILSMIQQAVMVKVKHRKAAAAAGGRQEGKGKDHAKARKG